MFMLRQTRLGIIAASLLCLSVVASAQSTNGSSSKLPAAKIREFTKPAFKVLVPTYIPAGFTFSKGGFEDLNHEDPRIAVYALTYKNAKTRAFFTIQMASDGLGDPMLSLPDGDTVEPTGTLKAKSPILGAVSLEFYKKGKIQLFNCTWMEHNQKSLPKFAMIYGEGFDANEGKKVLESLRWLKKR